MPRITVNISEDLFNKIEDHHEKEYENRSEKVRDLLKDGLNHEETVREFEEQIRDLEEQIDRLENEKRKLIQKREENQELVKFVEEQKSVIQQEKEIKNKPVWKRAKYWILGRNPE